MPPPDLAAHFGVGYLLASLLSREPLGLHPLIGVGAAVAVGIGKEVYDNRPGGTGFDKKDLLATSLGGGLAGLHIVIGGTW